MADNAISNYQSIMGEKNINNDFNDLYEEITDLQNKIAETSTPYDSSDATNEFVEKKFQNHPFKTNSGKYHNPNVQIDKCDTNTDEDGTKIVDVKKCGLYYNTKELIKEINNDNIKESFREYNLPLVEVTLKNGTKKKMSYDDFNNLSITAFSDSCKRFESMPKGLCLSNEKLSERPKNPLDPNVSINEEALTQQIMANNNIDTNMLTPNIDGFQPFYNRYKQSYNKLNNYDVIDAAPVDNIKTTEVYDSVEKNVLVIEKDLSTTLFIAGLSITGLYIISKMMK